MHGTKFLENRCVTLQKPINTKYNTAIFFLPTLLRNNLYTTKYIHTSIERVQFMDFGSCISTQNYHHN